MKNLTTDFLKLEPSAPKATLIPTALPLNRPCIRKLSDIDLELSTDKEMDL